MNTKELSPICRQVRRDIITMTANAGSGHPGGSLSAVELMTSVFFNHMRVDPKNPHDPNRDRFVLSKGHAAPCYYAVLAAKGFISRDEYANFRQLHSILQGHPDAKKVPGVDASTGSLGHGIPIAAGTAIAARVLGKDYYTYVVTGDGELDEGSNWEGLMTIRHYNLTNCITIVDRNHCMIDGNTEDVMKLEPLADKFVAFGFHTIVCEGNNIVSLCKAIDEAHKTKDKPTVIVADTIKGVGIKLTSGNYKWHYGAIDEEMAKVAAKDLDEYSAERIARCGKEFE